MVRARGEKVQEQSAKTSDDIPDQFLSQLVDEVHFLPSMDHLEWLCLCSHVLVKTFSSHTLVDEKSDYFPCATC